VQQNFRPRRRLLQQPILSAAPTGSAMVMRPPHRRCRVASGRSSAASSARFQSAAKPLVLFQVPRRQRLVNWQTYAATHARQPCVRVHHVSEYLQLLRANVTLLLSWLRYGGSHRNDSSVGPFKLDDLSRPPTPFLSSIAGLSHVTPRRAGNPRASDLTKCHATPDCVRRMKT
jgi:hypothetical protein